MGTEPPQHTRNPPTPISPLCTSILTPSRMTTPSQTSTPTRSVMVTMLLEDTRLLSLTAGPRLLPTSPDLMVMLLTSSTRVRLSTPSTSPATPLPLLIKLPLPQSTTPPLLTALPLFTNQPTPPLHLLLLKLPKKLPLLRKPRLPLLLLRKPLRRPPLLRKPLKNKF